MTVRRRKGWLAVCCEWGVRPQSKLGEREGGNGLLRRDGGELPREQADAEGWGQGNGTIGSTLEAEFLVVCGG